MSRQRYDEVDKEDRLAQLVSRTDTISKSFVTDLWMKVLHRAIDDVVLYTVMRENGVELKEEDLEFEASAHGFLFDDEYRIPMDDYEVLINCHQCNNYSYTDKMSILAANDSVCPECQCRQDEKAANYTIVNQFIKDISLQELLEMWNINDIDGFRKGTRARIEELVKKKQSTIKVKVKKEKNMANKPLRVVETGENFQPPTDSELTDFDKAIARVLDDTKIMLMMKNRKYGNSATKPVRAFSKADPQEQIKVRIDDKISRLIRSTSKEEDEDVVKDLIGYLVILAALQRDYI